MINLKHRGRSSHSQMMKQMHGGDEMGGAYCPPNFPASDAEGFPGTAHGNGPVSHPI